MNNYGVSRKRSTTISPQEGKSLTINWEEGTDFIFVRVAHDSGGGLRPRWIAFPLSWEAWDTLAAFVQQAREDAQK